MTTITTVGCGDACPDPAVTIRGEVTPATPDVSHRRLDDCSQVGYGDICPDSDAERLYAIIAMVIGGAFYGYIIGNISSIVSTTDANSRAYFEKMDLIHT